MEKRMEQKAPDVLREELALERFVGECLSQAVVEGEVALPGGLREETHVLSAEAMAVLDRASAENGRVTADGRVIFHVLYTQGDPTRISALEASAEFTHPMELPGAQAGMNAPVSLMTEHVEASAQGGRLHLMAILRVQARALTDEPVTVVSALRGVDGLEARTEILTAVTPAAQGVQDVLIRDECELGSVLQITDTLTATAYAVVQEVMGGEERATVSGQVYLEVTHLSAMPSRPLVVTRHTLPFEETIALPGESGDQLCVSAAVKDVAVLSQEGQEEGERTLRAEVLLGLKAESARQREVRLLLDAYTTQGEDLCLTSLPVRRAVAHRQLHTAESGKLTLVLDGEPPVRTPLCASIRPVMTEWSRQNGKLCVEGMMEITLLYMTDGSDAPVSCRTEEPFRMVFACEPTLPDSLTLTPCHVDVTGVTSDRVEVKYILHLDCSDVVMEDQPLVTQVSAQAAEAEEPGILLCFSAPGETAWQIARRYRVSPESLLAMNPSFRDGAQEKQRVILWRRTGE